MSNSNSNPGATADSSTQPKLERQAKLLPNPLLSAALSTDKGNALIAEFMGFKNLYASNWYALDDGITKGFYVDDPLCYHSSWDWLMTVVMKIEKNCKAHVTMFNNECWVEFYGVHNDPCKFHNKGEIFINNVWLALTGFIHWCNSQDVS